MKHSIEELRTAFSYDPVTGILTRIKWTKNAVLGPIEAGRHKTSYEGIPYIITHLIWALYYGYWPDCLVDHRDGDKRNTKIKNLRQATHQQNQFNKVGFGKYPKGVVFKADARRSKPWSARIRINGRKIPIGSYATMEEAAEAYRQAAEKYQGEFALHKSMELQNANIR